MHSNYSAAMHVMHARFARPKGSRAAEVPAAAVGHVTLVSAGSVGGGCTGTGGDETWCITLLQSQRSSRHWEVVCLARQCGCSSKVLEKVSRSVDVIVNIALMTS